ncbi:unnamed protein product [Paramecium pentaurelia]|uniref:VPS10 domain-containing protein n=1 Tax=Paramecium pentaurelia TaxID=43138 RepID=A0A8S1UUL4_9CILI|nr:unnamed protein product [Paramecium pentaurelia]
MIIILGLLILFVQGQNEVKVSFNELESPVSNIYWCGSSVVFTKDDETIEQTHQESRKVLFILTDKGRIWRSADYGSTWLDETKSWEKMEPENKQLQFESIHISPADSRVIFFFGSNGISYKSKNCGRTYTRFSHSEDLYDFKLNKMDPQWIMAFKDKPCGKNDNNCKDFYKKSIYVTEDGGETWKSALNYVRDAAWDKLLQYQLIPDQRIIVCHMKEGKSVISYSDDYFTTIQTMQENALGFFQTSHYIFVLTTGEDGETGYELLIAPAYLDKFQPQPVQLPIPLNQHTFTILDTSEGQIFLSVSHKEENQRLTNVYVSDFRGFKFTLSLLHNVRSLDTGNCDFERMLGMEGVYVANVFDHQEVEKSKSRSSITPATLELYKKTFISYDRGGQWHPLKAPEIDSKGDEIQCSGDCSLHLKGRTEANQNPLYSSQNAPGVSIGVGNTGLYLTQKDHEVNTYLTRDGGHQWFEIRKGSHMYEIGDRGGLIVMGQDDKPINKVIYSWDQGFSWEEVKISEKEFEILNIVTEPSNMEQKFILYGQSRSQENQLKGYVVALNFQTLHQRVCSGAWDPTMPESDYEFWIPKNFESGKCLFGRKIKYIRRKREAKCFNQEEIDKKFFIETCPCIEDDWECDFGFYRKIEGGPCVPIADKFEEDDTPDLLKPPVNCKQTYMKTQGYRKVSGDYCQGGIDLSPVETPCPNTQTNNTSFNNTEIPNIDIQQPQISKPQIKIPQTQYNNSQKQYSYLWYVVAFLGVIIVILFLKDKIMKIFSSKPPKKSSSYMEKGNYEQLKLFSGNDEDDEAGL